MNFERLSDLDELILRCRTEDAREHIAEAVAAYRGGAYRATIVMSWIAVVFDLMDKIRDLSIVGEPAASELLARFENYQSQLHSGVTQATKQALEFEREILGQVRDRLSLIDAQQLTDLERLREDRHRCAHPSFNRVGEVFRPPAELARLHLRNAITHVLSQPPVQGKAALSSLITLVSSIYFPTDLTKATTQLESSALNKATSTLVRHFVDALIFGYVEKGNAFEGKSQIPTVLSVVADKHRGIAEPRISQNFRKIFTNSTDEELPTAISFLANWQFAWDMLEKAQHERIISYLESADYESIAPSFPSLARITELVSVLQQRMRELDTKQLIALIADDSVRKIAVDVIINRYLLARSFLTAKIRRTQLLMPVLDLITSRQIRYLVAQAARNDQVRYETGFYNLLRLFKETQKMSGEEYILLLGEFGFSDAIHEDSDEGSE